MKKVAASLGFDEQGDESVSLEVSLKNQSLLAGQWAFDVRLGSKKLRPSSSWSKICEHSEKGCDYFEIELFLTGNYRLQRCLLVNHKDQTLLVSDSILAKEGKHTKEPLIYQAEFPVSPSLRDKTSGETTEIAFRSSSLVFRALPLALPEWKISSEKETESSPFPLVHGTFSEKEGKLVLRQETTGRSMFVPLFLDLNSDRLGKRYTWRQLAVGEDMKRVREDQAVGYRIQLDQVHFLIYRSLTPLASRTLLGHHLIDDFCFARFDPESGVDPLITIEAAQ